MTDGKLENWIQVGAVIHGQIFNDRKLRFEDGEYIRTSYILEIKDGCAYTRNSVYELGKQYEI